MPFDPANYEGQDRLAHIEKYMSGMTPTADSTGLVSTTLGGLSITGTTLTDDFERTGTFAGSDSTSGHTWSVTGTGTFSLSGGNLISNTVGAAYAQMELDTVPNEIGGNASWVTAAGATASSATLICGDNTLLASAVSSWNAVHLTMDNTSWRLQLVQAGAFTTLASAATSGLIDSGTKPVSLAISGNTATYVTTDGLRRSTTDSRIGTLAGKYVIYELITSGTGPAVRWESVYAKETVPLGTLLGTLLGATRRYRSTIKANKLLLDRGVGFTDTLTNLYCSTLNNLKTDGLFHGALGLAADNGILTLSQSVKIQSGPGAPNGVVTAVVGSVYLQNDGAAGKTQWVKETGTGNTGWTQASRVSGITALTYGPTVSIDASLDDFFTLNVTNGTAFTISAPTNAGTGRILMLDITNSSGGAMGVITWDPVFKRDASFANPANGKRRTIQFYYDGTNWVQVGASSADI